MVPFEYLPPKGPRNETQVQTPIEVQQALVSAPITSRPFTKEEYELYNRLPIWFNEQVARARATARAKRKSL